MKLIVCLKFTGMVEPQLTRNQQVCIPLIPLKEIPSQINTSWVEIVSKLLLYLSVLFFYSYPAPICLKTGNLHFYKTMFCFRVIFSSIIPYLFKMTGVYYEVQKNKNYETRQLMILHTSGQRQES